MMLAMKLVVRSSSIVWCCWCYLCWCYCCCCCCFWDAGIDGDCAVVLVLVVKNDAGRFYLIVSWHVSSCHQDQYLLVTRIGLHTECLVDCLTICLSCSGEIMHLLHQTIGCGPYDNLRIEENLSENIGSLLLTNHFCKYQVYIVKVVFKYSGSQWDKVTAVSSA